LDDLIQRQATLRDADARKAALFDIQRYILDQAWITHVWGFVTPSARLPEVRYISAASVTAGEHDPWLYTWLDQ
jgi:hypothetical protein